MRCESMSQSQHKRIFIVGHPGAGKGLLAKTIAEKLGWQFIDADHGLEFQVGRTLSEMLGKQGEENFQRCESDILSLLKNKKNIVVTTDASIVCNEKNRELLASEFVVNLKVSTLVQLERISRNQAPLLLIEDIKTFLDKLHHERDSLYEQVATFSIDSDDNALENHVMNIVKMILDVQDTKELNNTVNLNEKDFIIFHKKLHVPIHLTEQQANCLKLLAQGKTSKEIARDLKISYRTVEGYIAQTMELLGCASSKELIALYYDQP